MANAGTEAIQAKWKPEIQKCLGRLADCAWMLKSESNRRLSPEEKAAVTTLADSYKEDTVPRESPIPLRDYEERALNRYKVYMAERDTPEFKERLRILREASDEPEMIEPSGILEGTASLYFAIRILEFWHVFAQRQKEIEAAVNGMQSGDQRD